MVLERRGKPGSSCGPPIRVSDTPKRSAGAGERMLEMDPQRVAMIEDQMRASAHYHYDGSTEWAALLRKLERECPNYWT